MGTASYPIISIDLLSVPETKLKVWRSLLTFPATLHLSAQINFRKLQNN
ncbi:hypothetical protein [Oscillatoria salina]|nr:hypothetical protein [Oscillatoria salina IIICB1]NET89845.1 hypothetical protein [Kamptonema sp. SIO1D9]